MGKTFDYNINSDDNNTNNNNNNNSNRNKSLADHSSNYLLQKTKNIQNGQNYNQNISISSSSTVDYNSDHFEYFLFFVVNNY